MAAHLIADLRAIEPITDYTAEDLDELDEDPDIPWHRDTPPISADMIPSNDEEKACYPGYRDTKHTERQWWKEVKPGCSWCADPVDLVDAHEIMWYAPGEFFCATCKDEVETQQFIT